MCYVSKEQAGAAAENPQTVLKCATLACWEPLGEWVSGGGEKRLSWLL